MIERFKVQAHELRGSDHYELPGDVVLVRASDYAALEAELARVKAESLRVVNIGGPCVNAYTAETHCMYGGRLCAIISRCGGFVWLRAVGDGPDGDFDICTSTKVQPVRLERWEDADAD